MANKNQIERAPPAGEFDHAIQYLNKIKIRYPDDPNTYKQFLEILQVYRKEQQAYMKDDAQGYQREQKMMQDVRLDSIPSFSQKTSAALLPFARFQVYAQVSILFADAPDLLSEFKDFLPEISGTALPSGNLVGILPQPSCNSGPSSSIWNQEASATSPAPPKIPASRRRKREPAKEGPQQGKTDTARVSRRGYERQ